MYECLGGKRALTKDISSGSIDDSQRKSLQLYACFNLDFDGISLFTLCAIKAPVERYVVLFDLPQCHNAWGSLEPWGRGDMPMLSYRPGSAAEFGMNARIDRGERGASPWACYYLLLLASRCLGTSLLSVDHHVRIV